MYQDLASEIVHEELSHPTRGFLVSQCMKGGERAAFTQLIEKIVHGDLKMGVRAAGSDEKEAIAWVPLVFNQRGWESTRIMAVSSRAEATNDEGNFHDQCAGPVNSESSRIMVVKIGSLSTDRAETVIDRAEALYPFKIPD
jgi:hypothetical protein